MSNIDTRNCPKCRHPVRSLRADSKEHFLEHDGDPMKVYPVTFREVNELLLYMRAGSFEEVAAKVQAKYEEGEGWFLDECTPDVTFEQEGAPFTICKSEVDL